MTMRGTDAKRRADSPVESEAAAIDRHAQGSSLHLVQVYDDEDQLAASVTAWLADGLREGDAILVIATAAHWNAFVRHLAARGEDLEALAQSGRVTRRDAQETLATFMRDGIPDDELFENSVGELVRRVLAQSAPARVRAYGEMVDVLWQEGRQEAALRLEDLWTDLQGRHAFSLLCAYSMEDFHDEPSGLEDVLARHTHGEILNGDGSKPASGSTTEERLRRQARRLADETLRRREVEKALRASLAELGAQEEALRLSESQLRVVTDALPVLVSFVDAQQRYRFVSAGYERWFGHTKDEVIGKHLMDVLGPAAYTAIKPYVETALAGSITTYESEVPYRDGGTRFVEATYIPQRSSTGEVVGFVAFVADATERKTFEHFRAAEMARSERLLRVTAGIADAVRSEEVFVALVDRVAEAMNASSAALWLVDEDTGVARLARSLGYADAVQQQLSVLPLDLEPSLPALDSIRRAEAIWIPSQQALLESYPHLGSVVSRDRQYGAACLPLTAQGRVLGTLALTIESEGDLTTEERGFLLLIARYASQALERLRLFESERLARAAADAAAHRAEQLYAFAHTVSAASGLDEVFEAALSAIEAALGTHRLAILTHDQDNVMRFRAWRNLSPAYRGAVEGHSPWKVDATHFEPVLIPDALNEPALQPFARLFREEGIGALAFFPLVNRGRLLGKFMVYFDRPHRFVPSDVEIAGSIANHLASVITRFAAINRLEDTIRANELFAAVLAHDLRNPLGAIMNSAQVVLMRQEGQSVTGTAGDSQPLSRILRSGQRMTSMIDQLLDFTRARSGGGINVEPHATNLSDLCSQAIAELELVHPEWVIRCEVQGNAGGVWDAARLLQVISNLVSNAGQHGDPGGEIVVAIDGQAKDEVRLQVRNDGVIPEHVRPHLFDPFLGSRAQTRVGGLGLGLYIVREVVRAHGGEVEAISDATGTTVAVRLPRQASRSRVAAPA